MIYFQGMFQMSRVIWPVVNSQLNQWHYTIVCRNELKDRSESNHQVMLSHHQKRVSRIFDMSMSCNWFTSILIHPVVYTACMSARTIQTCVPKCIFRLQVCFQAGMCRTTVTVYWCLCCERFRNGGELHLVLDPDASSVDIRIWIIHNILGKSPSKMDVIMSVLVQRGKEWKKRPILQMLLKVSKL